MQSQTKFTNHTALPSALSEADVIRLLHDHDAMITQNPLVIHYEQCPQDAPDDEREGHWYQLTDRINYLPGGILQGKVNYRAYLHNTPQGLRTHVYAPLGVHIHNVWSVRPGEDSLALQEQVHLRCPFGVTNFIRRTMHKAHKDLVARLTSN
ncbi:hypothetical protein N7495_004851 [Penicillium taxi]|uniref:uncharacterized protein n=1 Tax=Penicillium taxi TaxID=168475 RepID=UPI002545B8D6|nr:uncharacterized protein N7495_004851 [Penicillium taxi]KAJ5900107.1 hypothetical protein N7495_004851 [Penicillium taxi]